MKKQCTKCFKELDVEEFHKKKNGKLGLHAECKLCIRLRTALYTAGHISEKRERDRKRSIKKRERIRRMQAMAKQLNLQSMDEESFESYKKKCEDSIKRQCRLFLNSAIAQGYVVKPNECTNCKDKHYLLHGHHFDYAKPLDVSWLCPKCHRKLN